MKLFLLAVVVLSGCSFTQRVTKECVVLLNGQTACECRDNQTGRYVRCER